MSKIDFQRMASLVASFRGDKFLADDMLRQQLTIAAEGDLSVVWAPFEYNLKTARVVLVGICPGRTQAEEGLHAFRDALRQGMTDAQALRHTKLKASFSGAMRKNLVNMQDRIRLNELFHLDTCDRLFQKESEYVHFTSAIRYPVFVKRAKGNKDYNGSPNMLRTPVLRKIIDGALVEEARLIQGAVFWISMGPKPVPALEHLAANGVLRDDQILEIPHPSGANAERISYFLGKKKAERLSKKTDGPAIDRARQSCIAKVEAQLRLKKKKK